MSFAIALPLARAYADLGLAGYNKLANAFKSAQKEGTPISWDSNSGIASAMVMSFAAELFIKVLVFQRTGSYPRGHILADLVCKLPAEAQAGVKTRYAALVAQKANLLKLKYEFIEHPPGSPPAPPSAATEPPPDDWPGHVFEDAIALASPLFVKLRYLYEEITNGFSAEIDFRWLIFLIEALSAEIDSYKEGEAKLTWG